MHEARRHDGQAARKMVRRAARAGRGGDYGVSRLWRSGDARIRSDAAQAGMLSPGAGRGASYILEARGVRKVYGDHEVLKGVDLLVSPGEMVFLIGPSGSGKSTLLRCCNRLEEPSGGSILIGGVDLLSPRTDINTMRRE